MRVLIKYRDNDFGEHLQLYLFRLLVMNYTLTKKPTIVQLQVSKISLKICKVQRELLLDVTGYWHLGCPYYVNKVFYSSKKKF